MKLLKRMLIALLVACSVILVAPVVTPIISDSYTVEAASVKLNQKKIYLVAGSKYKLKVSGTKKKVKWSSSKKSVAKVSSTGYVTAVKTGTATITAKVGNKKYKCTVKVTKNPVLKSSVKKAYKQGDCFVLEGFVKNKTFSKLKYASIKVTAYDKNGKVLGSTSDSIMWMDSRGQWKVKLVVYVGKGNVSKYKTQLRGAYFLNNEYNPKFKAKVTKLTSKDNKYTATAKFTNKNKVKLKSVYATYAFYDKNGNIIGTRFCGYYAKARTNGTAKLGNGLKYNKSFTASESLSYADYKVTKCKVVEVHGYDI